jgi:hypothetical protein
MQLYSSKDVELAKIELPKLIKQIDNIKDSLYSPTKKEKLEINKIVLKYVKEHKLKIYGGYAINKLIVEKNPEDRIYEPDSVADIDCYSPTPVLHLKTLANIFFDLGYQNVEGKEALHRETYTLFVNSYNSCDLSYTPTNVFHRIPFDEIDGVYFISSSFAMIDMYKQLTEPYFSGAQRWEKVFPRLYKLQKNYPFKMATSKLIDPDKIDNNPTYIKMLDACQKYIESSKSLIVYGRNAYNFFLKESKILESNEKIYKVLENGYRECVSTNYVKDVVDLINLLKKIDNNIVLSEHYPFSSLSDYSCYIKFNNITVVKICNYQKKCSPVITHKNINYGSFDFCLLLNMINAFYMRVNRDEKRYQFYNVMTSHLIQIRNFYLKQTKKTLFDESPFQSFLVHCIGAGEDPRRAVDLLRKEKHRQHKNPIFRYNPETMYEKTPETIYSFPNSSGNLIYNAKNYIITDISTTRETGDDGIVGANTRHKIEALTKVEVLEDSGEKVGIDEVKEVNIKEVKVKEVKEKSKKKVRKN